MSRVYHTVGTAFLGELQDPGVGRAEKASAEIQFGQVCVSFEMRGCLELDFGGASLEFLRNFSEEKLDDVFGLEFA